MKRRFIEVDFPIEEVSRHSAREKNIRHGHISALHVWWARRPLAASRASIYAALIPEPKNEQIRLAKAQFIADLARWENSLDQRVIGKARREILEANGGEPPKVLDCFAGGGSIPLEALRLGCEAHALELNSVAVLILKATLEYAQKYGEPKMVAKLRPPRPGEKAQDTLAMGGEGASLADDVRYWGNWVLEEAGKELAQFYPQEPDGGVPVGYIWARTIACQNPECRAEIRLMRQFWLARKLKKKVALKPLIDRQQRQVDFHVVEGKEIDFDAAAGTAAWAKATCPVCMAGVAGNSLRREFCTGHGGERMVAAVLHHPHRRGKGYRAANEQDVVTFGRAESALREKVAAWPWKFTPVPDEPTPFGGGSGAARAFSVRRYGMDTWGDLFNPRQKLALATFTEKVRLAHESMLATDYDQEYWLAVTSYLTLSLGKILCYQNRLTRWNNRSESFAGKPDQSPTLPMRWDYSESNPFGYLTGSWSNQLDSICKVLSHQVRGFRGSEIRHGTATHLPYPRDFFDAVITDPPHYDNIPYADLSDFFYVWLRRAVGDLYPDLFATPLTPKSQEIIEDEMRHLEDGRKAKQFFEQMLTKAFAEMRRVLKPSGVGCVVFAHKSTDAWEAVIQALLHSGLNLSASWPVDTERKGRQRAQKSAALASSIYMVCRKRTKERVAYFNELRPAIEERVRERLTDFWNAGIGGADFFVSAIGPAVEVFGQYSRVERLSGEEVTVPELLEYVRQVVSQFALERILRSPQLVRIDTLTRFYLLWRWTYNNARVVFDDARKLAQPMGVELTEHWGQGGFINKEGKYIRVLGPEARAGYLLGEHWKPGPDIPMIDVLQRCLLLWERSNRKAIGETLLATGLGAQDFFWQVAQAISEVQPEGDKERQLLQGLLYGRREYEAAALTGEWKQKRLFEEEGGWK